MIQMLRRLRVQLPTLLFSVLAIILTVLLRSWIAYSALAIVMAASIKLLRKEEEADPMLFVRILQINAIVICGAILYFHAGLGASRMFSVPVLSTAHFIDGIQLPIYFSAACYLAIVFFTLDALRKLERRPTFALLLLWNPAVLLLIGHGSSVIWLAATLSLFSSFLVLRRQFLMSAAVLGIAFGIGLCGLVALPFLVRHIRSNTPIQERKIKIVWSLVLFFFTGIAASYSPVSHSWLGAETLLIGEYPWIAGSVLLSFALVIQLMRKVEVSTTDLLLYVFLLAETLAFLVLGHWQGEALLWLIPLAALYRSAAHIWLIIAVLFCNYFVPVHWTFQILSLVVFLALFIPQLLNAYRDTGLFRRIELRDMV